MAKARFADALIEGVRRVGSPLCVGLDPFPEHLPPLFGDAMASVQPFADFFAEILALTAGKAAIVKPQLGFFEPYGGEGFDLARALTNEAQAKGVLVLLDAKRGDIGSTADGYARATLGPAPGFDADCVTVNPYLGMDTIEPFLTTAEARGKGVSVLVRTSNPGAGDLQDLDSGGKPIWRHVAERLDARAERLIGETGWSGMMGVVGATWPDQARAIRSAMPRSLFLVPGYGAQGASAADAVAGFVRGAHGLEGGVVSSSRGVLYPAGAKEAGSLAVWRALVADAIARAHAELAQACK